MMSNQLLKVCQKFYKKAMELDPEMAKELGQDLKAPTIADQTDIQILIGRAAKALENKNIKLFAETMIALDRLLREFFHESFEPEFYDFASDQDLWDWINSLKNKESFSKDDWALASIIRDNLLYFKSKGTLFN